MGTPAEILSEPADDFVANFIGAGRGRRALRIEQTPTGPIVVDGDGRAAGVLTGPVAVVDAAAAVPSTLPATDEAGASHDAAGAPAQGGGLR